jgi:deazaflavin-dependent oxidoreductase (nitroreductase family)
MSEKFQRRETSTRKAPTIPTDMKAFNAKLIADFHANDGQFTGDMAGRGLLILTTTGARSGEPRSVVVGFGRQGDRLVVIASDNGAPKPPDWYHNLLANPSATIELAGPERFEVRASTAGSEERAELAKAVPYLAQQQSLTEREIPIVVFERL